MELSFDKEWKRGARGKAYIALEVDVLIITERLERSSGLNNDWEWSNLVVLSFDILFVFDGKSVL